MAFCTSCGAQVPDGAATCQVCGSVIYEHMNQQGTAQPQQQGYAPQPTAYSQPQQGEYYQPPLEQSPYAQPQADPYAQQAPYGQPQPNYAQPQYTQQPYQQFPVDTEQMNNATKARNLGIASIILAFFIPLVGIILGSVGGNKAKAAALYAQQLGNAQLLTDAEHAKKLCRAGIIVAIISWVISGIIFASSGLSNY